MFFFPQKLYTLKLRQEKSMNNVYPINTHWETSLRYWGERKRFSIKTSTAFPSQQSAKKHTKNGAQLFQSSYIWTDLCYCKMLKGDSCFYRLFITGTVSFYHCHCTVALNTLSKLCHIPLGWKQQTKRINK